MTKNAATSAVLGDLHKKVATIMIKTLDNFEVQAELAQAAMQAAKDDPDAILDIPEVHEPSAALLGAITKFLKDNDVTCNDETDETRSKLEERLAAKRAARNGQHIKLADVLPEEAVG